MKASRNHIRCLFARERKQSSPTTNTLARRIKAARAKYGFIYAASPFIVSESVSEMIAIFVYLWKHCCPDRRQWEENPLLVLGRREADFYPSALLLSTPIFLDVHLISRLLSFFLC